MTPAQDRDGAWYPDGRRILFSSDRSGRFELYSQPREGDGWGPPVELTEDGGIFPALSPDGRLILFLHGDRIALLPSSGGRTTDLVLTGPLSGREADILLAIWTPDSRDLLLGMAADSSGEQQLWAMPLDGGAPRLLVRFDEPGTGLGRGNMVARGGTLYFMLLRSESDVWTVELARR